jgi:bifunctional DNA-binding transcriptional regulator/antitoxin component of YhaV-PrlF toxin-antitoxin module
MWSDLRKMSEQEPVLTAIVSMDDRGRITIPEAMRQSIKEPKKIRVSLYMGNSWKISLESVKK